LTETDFVELSRFMEGNPSVPLRAYRHFGIQTDLEFLRHFPFLKEFQADLFDLVSLPIFGRVTALAVFACGGKS
jgi:hypothetical protein